MAEPITVYGIPNCDTVKKARKWLDTKGIDYEFHDYKKKGIDTETLTAWCEEIGWEKLLNKRGTTWRKLREEEKSDLTQPKAIALMTTNTSIIKRPVIEARRKTLVGFSDEQYNQELSGNND